MRICEFYGGYYPGSGGIETHIRGLAERLDHDVEVLTDAFPEFPRNEPGVIRTNPQNQSISKKIPRILSRLGFPLRLINDIRRANNKKKLLMKKKYDLVHFHSSGVGGALMRFCLLARTAWPAKGFSDFSFIKNKIVTVHGLSHLLVDDPVIKDIEMSFISQFDRIICIDKKLHDYLSSKLKGKKIFFIPNSIDTERFSYKRPKPKKKLCIGFIGRLEKSRGIHLLIELIKKKPDFTEIMVLGAGNNLDFERFKQAADMNKITLFTNFPYKAMPEFYHKFDVLFNPVIAEGISRVTLEAMATGNPVIMLDKGDRYPLVDGKTGFLIQDDIKDLLALLGRIRKDGELLGRISRDAREKVKNEFDHAAIIPKIERAIR